LSINSDAGVEQSQRDDLESLSYVSAYLLRGDLPWQSLEDQLSDHLIQAKRQVSPTTIFFSLLNEFLDMYKYAHALSFDAKPDYEFLRGTFWDLYQRLNLHSHSEALNQSSCSQHLINRGFHKANKPVPSDQVCVICSLLASPLTFAFFSDCIHILSNNVCCPHLITGLLLLREHKGTESRSLQLSMCHPTQVYLFPFSHQTFSSFFHTLLFYRFTLLFVDQEFLLHLFSYYCVCTSST